MRRLKRVLSAVLLRRPLETWIVMGCCGVVGAVIASNVGSHWMIISIGFVLAGFLVAVVFELFGRYLNPDSRSTKLRPPDLSTSDTVKTTTSTSEISNSPDVPAPLDPIITVSFDHNPYFIKSLRSKQKQEPSVLEPVTRKSCVRHIRVKNHA